MSQTRTLWRFIIAGMVLYLSACTLSTTPKQPTAAPTQQIIIFPTNQPPATNTPQPSLTPLPLNTAAPARPTATPVYIVSRLVPGPVCSISPTVAGANVRSGPGTNFPIIGVVPAANWVSATRIDSNGWYQITSPGTPVEGGWMSNTVVALQQPCVCGPNNCVTVTTPYPTFTPQPIATATFEPTICYLTLLNLGDSVPAYTQPTTDNSPELIIQTAQRFQVVGRTNDGWYGVIRGNGQAAYIGIYTLIWIRSDAKISLTGAPCGQLKVIDLSYPAPTGCTLTPKDASSIPVYNQYDFSIAASGVLNAPVTANVVGKSPAGAGGVADGWYAIEPTVVQAGNVGKYRLKWVPLDRLAEIGGDCTTVPTLSLEP